MVKALSDFRYGDGHPCQPRFADIPQLRPRCVYCSEQLVRILHGPGHTINGRPCGFPERWRHCFLPARIVDAPSTDFLRLPEWTVG